MFKKFMIFLPDPIGLSHTFFKISTVSEKKINHLNILHFRAVVKIHPGTIITFICDWPNQR